MLREEKASAGISEVVQRKIEDLLEDVEANKQFVDGMAIKARLHKDRIEDSTAGLVVQLCLLQSRFTEGIRRIVDGQHSPFAHLSTIQTSESAWFGSLHFLELVYSSEGTHKKMHAVFSPTIPRVGELIEPEKGSRRRVVDVMYAVALQGKGESLRMPILIPHVILEACDDE